MRSLGAVVVAGAVLAFASAGTASSGDHAQPRGGGSGGGGSRSAGASHHSGGGGGSSSGSSSSSSGSYRDSGGSSAGYRSAPPTGAQARHPRAGTGTGYRYYGYGYGHGYYPGYYPYYGGYPYYGSYYPYYGAYYGLGWGYGWSPYFSASWYGYPYGSYGIGVGYAGGYGGGDSGHYDDDGEGSVRLQVQPNEAKVYVDGYYAGTVDDFDGTFQRLRISPGRHDIAVKLDGFRTHTFKVYVPIDQTLKLQHKMVPGTGDDVSEVVGKPEDIARYEQKARQQSMPRYEQQPRGARPPEEGGEDDFRYDSDRASDQRGERGLVRLDVRPADASVYVDGAFRGTGRELRQLRLTPGRHQVEVVRPGYRTIAREVDVQGGEDSDVTIDLDRSS